MTHVAVVAVVAKLATLPASGVEFLLAPPHADVDARAEEIATADATPIELPERTHWPSFHDDRPPAVISTPRIAARPRTPLLSEKPSSRTVISARATAPTNMPVVPARIAEDDHERSTADATPPPSPPADAVAPLELSLGDEPALPPAVPLVAEDRIPAAPAHAAKPSPIAETAPVQARPPSPLHTPDVVRPARTLAFGLGLAGIRVDLDGAHERSTRNQTETISGSIVNSKTTQATIAVNGVLLPLSLEDGRFRVDVALLPGTNSVRIVAVDDHGITAEAKVAVEYIPPPADGIAITVPANGVTLTRHDPPIVAVHGRVDDPAIPSVSLSVNQMRWEVPVQNGTFQHVIPVVGSAVEIIAEVGGNGTPLRRSSPVVIRAADDVPPTAVLFVDWGTAQQRRGVRATWRGRSDRLDGPSGPVTLTAFPAADSPVEVFYVRGIGPGVYTFVAEVDAPPPTARLYIPIRSGMAVRHARPRQSGRGGVVTLAKILMPFGVLWEQDDWFGGQSLSSDTITKFSTDGVSWIERRTDVP